ncbi:MAG: helix-turn-helix transcriptional regulator [Snowella sp.]|nr:helix-turn-helix transcriptional regulator [Snowella sp.]
MKKIPPYAAQLTELMQQAGIASLDELREISGLSGWQLSRIQYGLLPKMSVEALIKLAQALKLSLESVISYFDPDGLPAIPTDPVNKGDRRPDMEQLQNEYQRLQQQLEEQRERLQQEFQQQALDTLESWLLQWPTAAAAAQKNPDFPAVKLLPLVKPFANLLNQWQVEAIASVGDTLPYDPQWHQLMDSNVEPGSSVVVRYVGYRQAQKLLYRAKVSPAPPREDTPPENPSQSVLVE